MKYALLLFFFTLSFNIFAENRVPSPNYRPPLTKVQNLNKLKNYIYEAKRLVNQYKLALEDYKNVLKNFVEYRNKCNDLYRRARNEGSMFQNAAQNLGCNNQQIANLSDKLKRIALKLDNVEIKIKKTKYRIQLASDIIANTSRQKQISNQANSVLREITNVRNAQRNLENIVK